MLKVSKVQVFNFEGAFRGLRNPLNSWHLSDSRNGIVDKEWFEYADIDEIVQGHIEAGCEFSDEQIREHLVNEGISEYMLNNDTYNDSFFLGANDLKLAQRMIGAGTDESKFMRQIFISMDITAPLYW